MQRDLITNEFNQLLGQLTEGGLSHSDHQRLGELLESDPDYRNQYLNYCQLHAILRSEHGLLTALNTSEQQFAEPIPVSNRGQWARNRSVLIWAMPAVFLFVAGFTAFIALSREAAPYRGAEIALLSKVVGAHFKYGVHGELSSSEGVRLRQGLYELVEGLIEIQYNSGAILVLKAPATFNLVDESSVQLEDGQLSAHVPPAATGFRIESPGATVIDLGTDFAVQAVSQQESEVHVFQGEVLVDLHGEKGQAAERLRLVSGEATRVDFVTGMPSGIDLNPKQFLRSLRGGASSYAQTVLALNPAVYYRMEPTSDGKRLIDSSPSGADAKIHFGRGNKPVWTAGKVGAALTLGGPAEQTYASASEYPQTQDDTLSVSAWVYARSRPRWASIAKNWAGGDEDKGQFHFGLFQDGGELEVHIFDSSGRESIVKDKVPLPLDRWHHVAFVADGSMLRLYRNGLEVAAAAYQTLHRDPRISALAIGTKLNLRGDGPEERDFNMWDGCLDELAIFNHALSPTQVLELYELAEEAD